MVSSYRAYMASHLARSSKTTFDRDDRSHPRTLVARNFCGPLSPDRYVGHPQLLRAPEWSRYAVHPQVLRAPESSPLRWWPATFAGP